MIDNYIKSMMLPVNEDSFIVSDILVDCEEVQKDELFKSWNSQVDENDKILILGNFGFDIQRCTNRLNGKKILLMGPRDNHTKYDYLVNGFVEVVSQFTFNFSKNSMQKIYDSLIYKKFNDSEKLHFYKQLWKKDYASCYISDIGDKRFMFSYFPLNEDEKNYEEVVNALNIIFEVAKCDVHINHQIIDEYLSKNSIKKPIKLKELLKAIA